MKKILFRFLSVLMACVLLVTQLQYVSAKPIVNVLPSVDESIFNLDENALGQALTELNKLDDYLALNASVTYADLSATGSDLVKNITDDAVPMGASGGDDALLGIPPFWWGCLLSWVGWLLVSVLTDHDKDLTKKAFTGCLVNAGVNVVFSVLYVLLLASTETGYYY